MRKQVQTSPEKKEGLNLDVHEEKMNSLYQERWSWMEETWELEKNISHQLNFYMVPVAYLIGIQVFASLNVHQADQPCRSGAMYALMGMPILVIVGIILSSVYGSEMLRYESYREKKLEKDRDRIKREVEKLGLELGLIRNGNCSCYPTAKKKKIAVRKILAGESHLHHLHPVNNVSDRVQENYVSLLDSLQHMSIGRSPDSLFCGWVAAIGLLCSFSLSFVEYHLFCG